MLTTEERLEIFKDELKLIEVESVKNFTQEILAIIPDYFFHVPTSSAGKYHPKYSLGESDLIRHTRAAVQIAYELFKLELFHPIEKSIILSALILHDGCKHGRKFEKHSIHEHPVVMVDLIREQRLILEFGVLDILCGAIASHMGQWNTNKYSAKILPVPQGYVERFVHLCDYLASRKFIEILFNIDGRP